MTLREQGGLLSARETRAFLSEPHAEAAILLRRWDNHSKDPDADVPPSDYFRPYVCEALAGHGAVAL